MPQDFDVNFNWDYDEGRATMMGLYRKGVEMQWNAETRIDWTQELDEDNPEQLPEEMLPISGMAQYEAMSRARKRPRCAATSRAGRSASSCRASRAR